MSFKFNTLEQVRTKAAVMELRAMNLYDANGAYALDENHVARIEFIFIDGELLRVSPDVFRSREFNQLEFRLVPTQRH